MSKGNYYSLTHPQKRVWYIEKIYPNTSCNNVGGLLKIKGDVNFKILEEAIHLFIQKNEGLRLQFTELNGEVKQYVKSYFRIPICKFDFSNETHPIGSAEKWSREEFSKPFDLYNQPLFTFALIHISDQENGYLIKLHHIVSDGWSILLLTNQIAQYYNKLLNGEYVDKELANTYLDYLKEEQKYLVSKRFEKDKDYWQAKLKNLPETFLYKDSVSTKGNRKRFQIDKNLSQALRSFTKEYQCSLNNLFVVLIMIYLYKTTQQEEIIIGVPVLNRAGVKEKNIVGMFTSTMPFFSKIDVYQTINEFIRQVEKDLRKSFFHQKYPYDLIAHDLKLAERGYDNLFQWCVNYYNTKLTAEFAGAAVENDEYYSGDQTYSLQLAIKEWSDEGEIQLQWDYKIDNFSDQQIEHLNKHLIYLIQQVISNPMQTINEIQILQKKERLELLYSHNQTEAAYPDMPIHLLFEQQVILTPDRICLSFNNYHLTYAQLNRRANQLAHHLRKKGISRESLVGIMTEHSFETIVGIIAILKSGASYLPIDPDYPFERINYLLKDSGTSSLLTNVSLHAGIFFSGEIIDLTQPTLYLGESSNLKPINKMSDPVYVIYTSGSTGNPKGVVIENRGLVNYIYWASQTYMRNEEDVFAFYSSLSFDLTVTSIFTPLVSGGCVAIYSGDSEEFIIQRILLEKKATIIKLTPAHLSLIKQEKYTDSSVHTLIVGGEDLKKTLAYDIYESFARRVTIFNEYGPTETVVGCMTHSYDLTCDHGISVPIGRPINNTSIYLLDSHLEPVPYGVVGEIYIGGAGVTGYYLNRPELNLERFITDPFHPENRMYKTGDLAVRNPDGMITYRGRSDSQIKIKGYRIETGEIENWLINFDYVHEAIVIDYVDEYENKHLIAYLVMTNYLLIDNLKKQLRLSFPSYMIPTYLIPIDKFPLTPNGKLNRKALPDPLQSNQINGKFSLSSNKIYENLAFAMQEVLRIDHIKPTDNFFSLGGDSVKAIQVVSKSRTLGLHIKIRDILSYPMFGELAAMLEEYQPVQVEQTLAQGLIKPTPISEWFFQHNFTKPQYWNQSVLLILKQKLDVDELCAAFSKLVLHHDSLRLVYDSKHASLVYDPSLLKQEIPIEVHDLSEYDATTQTQQLEQRAEVIKQSLNLEQGFLFRLILFELGTEQQLLITAHHLIIDAVSWRILLEDLSLLLDGLKNQENVQLPPKSNSMQAWAESLTTYSKGDISKKEVSYWDSVIQAETAFSNDFDHGQDDVKYSHTLKAMLSMEQTIELFLEANKCYRTQTNDLLIAALTLCVGTSSVVLELEGHGRESLTETLDVSRTVGWFTSIYPVHLVVESSDLAKHIKSIKEQLRAVPNKGINFGILSYLSKSLPTISKNRIRFNYLGDTNIENKYFSLSDKSHGAESDASNQLTALIDINVMVTNNVLTTSITFSQNKFYTSTINNFLKNFMNHLDTIIRHCCYQKEEEFTPSDFDTIELSQNDLDDLFE